MTQPQEARDGSICATRMGAFGSATSEGRQRRSRVRLALTRVATCVQPVRDAVSVAGGAEGQADRHDDHPGGEEDNYSDEQEMLP